jgi:hypothetical protein
VDMENFTFFNISTPDVILIAPVFHWLSQSHQKLEKFKNDVS